MTRSQKARMLAGDLYDPSDPKIRADQASAQSWLARYNASLSLGHAERRALLREQLGSV